MEVLVWLRENGFACDTHAFDRAATKGHLHVLRWLLANRCPYDGARVCANAAATGSLQVLKWARQAGFNWSEQACMQAAEWGHLEVLQWLRASGCPWDETEMRALTQVEPPWDTWPAHIVLQESEYLDPQVICDVQEWIRAQLV